MKTKILLAALCTFAGLCLAGSPSSARRMRVGLLTDTHLKDDPATGALVRQAMQLFKREGVDAIFHLGDLADIYSPAGFRTYRQAVEDAFGAEVPLTLYAFGGHDRNGYRLKPGETDREETVWNIMKKVFKVSHGLYETVEFRGYAFVIIQEYMNARRARDLVAKAVAAHPNQPVFVLMHEPGWNTTDNSVGWGNTSLRKILDDYPQVIHLSGHTHGSNRNERNIWQGSYTEVSLGCLQYWTGQIGNHRGPSGKADDGVMTMDVFEDAVVFHRFALSTGREYRPEHPWTVPLPFDAKTAPYNPATRRARSKAPVWPAAAEAAVTEHPDGSVLVTVPEAQHEDQTYRYTAELCDRAGKRITLVQELGEFWKTSERIRTGKVNLDFDAAFFAKAGAYTIAVRPESFYGNVGAALTATVRRQADDTRWKTLWSSESPMTTLAATQHAWGRDRKNVAPDADGWLKTDRPMYSFDFPPEATLPAGAGDCRLVLALEDDHDADGSWEIDVSNAATDRVFYSSRLLTVQGSAGLVTYAMPFKASGAEPLRIRLGLWYGMPTSRLRIRSVRLDVKR